MRNSLKLSQIKSKSALLLAVLCTLGCSISPEEAFEKGFELYDSDLKQESYPFLKKAYEGGISNPELAIRLAFCRIAIDENPSGAIEILTESALNFPDYPETYHQLGLIAHNYGTRDEKSNLSQAIHFTRMAVELAPAEWTYHDNLGAYYYLAEELDSALVMFKKANELHPDDTDLAEIISKIEEKLNR